MRPIPECKDMKMTIPLLCKAYKESHGQEIVYHAAWALGYISEIENNIEDLLNTEIVESLIDHLL